MQLLERPPAQELVFGVGLVGGAVARALMARAGVRRTETLATSWTDSPRLSAELDAARAWLGDHDGPLRLFWCAGRGGFASSEAELSREFASFEIVVRWARAFAQRRPVEFHLTSSAGGIHEGQRRVTDAAPAPTLRPYARLKLQQEQLLADAPELRRFVYRPSSIYGVPRRGARLGMIPTLIQNALARRPSTISAHPSTLRDYVSVTDVGAFMASESNLPGLHYLVMGRPLSLFSLVTVVERALQRKVAVVYTTTRTNDQHITFSPSLRPLDWNPGSIESQVALLVASILKR